MKRRLTFQFVIVLDLNLVIFLRDAHCTLIPVQSQDAAHQTIHLVLLFVPHRSARVNLRDTILAFVDRRVQVFSAKILLDPSNV